MKIMLKEPEYLNITGPGGETSTGGSQEWYEDRWHRMSGCGPVAASNLIWYMTRRGGGKELYTELMREMYSYMTPGVRGVNSSGIFIDGITRYGAMAGLDLSPKVLEIPGRSANRPDVEMVISFITSALLADAPVAFLNLSNGALEVLESWHWVTIIAMDTSTRHADACDYGSVLSVDIPEWLKTSRLGGSFACFACTAI